MSRPWRLVAALILVVAWPAAAGGQEPPEEPAEPVEEPAIEPPPPSPFLVTVSVGRLGSGTLQVQPVRADRLDEDGAVMESAELARSVSVEGGYRAQAGVTAHVGGGWRLRLGGSYGRSRLVRSYAGDDIWVAEAAALPVPSRRGITVLGAESAIRFDIPTEYRLQPYLEVGAAAERWHGEQGAGVLAGDEGLADGRTRFAGLTAVGGHYPLTERLAARLHVSARFHRTPVDPMAPEVEIAAADDLVVTTQAVPARPFGDAAVELVTRMRLDLGVSYSLGRPEPAPPVRPGSAASPSAPPR